MSDLSQFRGHKTNQALAQGNRVNEHFPPLQGQGYRIWPEFGSLPQDWNPKFLYAIPLPSRAGLSHMEFSTVTPARRSRPKVNAGAYTLCRFRNWPHAGFCPTTLKRMDPGLRRDDS